jgi:hypothetical protein
MKKLLLITLLLPAISFADIGLDNQQQQQQIDNQRQLQMQQQQLEQQQAANDTANRQLQQQERQKPDVYSTDKYNNIDGNSNSNSYNNND